MNKDEDGRNPKDRTSHSQLETLLKFTGKHVDEFHLDSKLPFSESSGDVCRLVQKGSLPLLAVMPSLAVSCSS